ncbi:hypothetical protein, partial [Paenibacillus sp. Marseille-Q9583]
KENFYKLVGYLNHAFIGAFAYLICTIFLPIISEVFTDSLATPYVIVLVVLLIYMLLSALRFAMYIHFIFRKDLNKVHAEIEQAKLEKKEQEKLIDRVKVFLDDYEQRSATERSTQMSDFLRSRNREQ